MAGLVDIHTHLSSSEFDPDRKEVLDRALQVCDFLIDIGSGTSTDAFEKAREFAEQNERVYFTAGIHPHDADALGKNEDVLKRLTELYSHPKCVAIGECGLDYFYNNSSKPSQIRIFEWHIEKAKEFNLPLMIHTRDAEEDTMKLLESYTGDAVFHCFTSSQKLADFGISKGFYISFSGIVTFKKAEDLRQVFLKLPLEKVVVETDSPFLAPIPMRGKRNESSYVEHTAQFLSDLSGQTLENFKETTSANARRLFTKVRL